LELGQPPIIDDADVEVSEPTPVDDAHIGPNGIVPTSGNTMPNALIAFVPVVRIICGLKKTLRSKTITNATLEAYDEHFRAIMNSWPDPYPIHSNAPLDPALFSAIFLLQIARFHLYRHNTSPACRPVERQQALYRCLSVAKDTAVYLQRSIQTASAPRRYSGTPSPEWVARMANTSPFFVVTHFWRCALISAFWADYSTALTCVTAMASVGDNSKFNAPCGRYLEFFLDCLMERIHTGRGTPEALENDEEMLCYVSGDMQGIREYAWAWNGSEALYKMSLVSTTRADMPSRESGQGQGQGPSSFAAQQGNQPEWSGWQRVLDMLVHLQQTQQRKTSLAVSQGGQSHLPTSAPQQPQSLYQHHVPPTYPQQASQAPGPSYFPPPQRPLSPYVGGGSAVSAQPVGQPGTTDGHRPTTSSSRMNIKDLMH